MNKKTHSNLVRRLKYTSSELLEVKLNTFNRWINNHALKQTSLLWKENGNYRERARKENQYSMNETVSIGGTTIRYTSRCAMSRKNVFWNDTLSIDGNNSQVSFEDINYLSTTIYSILDKRNYLN